MSGDEFNRTLQDLLGLALPVILFAAATSALVIYVLRVLGSPVSKATGILPVAFAILGGICGVIAGASSETLVGGLVTGVLGIVSALMSYAFTRETDEPTRSAIPAIVILLLINALIGLSVGQNWKRKWVEYEKELAEYRTEYNEIWVPITKEYQMQVLRRCVVDNKSYEDVRAKCSYSALFSATK